MRWLVIDSSSNTGDQRTPGVLAPDAFQGAEQERRTGTFHD